MGKCRLKRWIAVLYTLVLFMGLAGCKSDAPTLYTPDISIQVGDIFYEMEDVQALDSIDGDITNLVRVIQSSVNIMKEGTYRITYEVTNSRGTTVISTRKIRITSVPLFFSLPLIFLILAIAALTFGIILMCSRRR